MASQCSTSSSSSVASANMSSPRRLRRGDHKDSFNIFARAPLGDQAARNQDANRSGSNQRSEPLWYKIIMTPVLSVAFILSLLFVERSHRAERVARHPQANQSFWESFQQWLDPEPYQDPNDTTWQVANAGESGVPETVKPRWFARKKHRKLTKLQLDEAADMHKSVILLLVTAVGLALSGLFWFSYRAYHWLRR